MPGNKFNTIAPSTGPVEEEEELPAEADDEDEAQEPQK